MDKFVIACCIFSFITGIYAAVIIDQTRGCTVKFVQGQVTHIVVGHINED